MDFAATALPRGRGAVPRCVAQLTFPEILVIWALRHYTGCRQSHEARAAVLAREFSRAFGLACLEQVLATFTRLADSLAASARLPQALSVLEDDRINATEEALLATLAALQHGASAQAAALSEWSLLPAGRATFLAAAGRLAQAMREAGHMIPYKAPPQRALMLGNRRDAMLPPAMAAASLLPAERMVVTALRVWVVAFRRQEDALGAVRAHFDQQFNASDTLWGDRRSGDDAGLGLHAVLRNTTLAASRPVDVRCPACAGLSADEARLLDAVAWLQRSVAEPAVAALGDWLPPAALRLSLGSARALAQALLTAEQSLPLRSWDLAALAAGDEPPPPGRCDPDAQPAADSAAHTVH